jgi:5'-nucleotidase
VVLIHEGGIPTGDYNDCPDISGPIVDIVKRFDKAVDIVVSGHTHRAYVCEIDGRLVTSADKYGTLVTEIDVRLDRKTRNVVSAKAGNTIVRTDAFAKDAEQTKLIAAYDERAKPIASRPTGKITDSIVRDLNAAGESVLGDIIADAQLAATATDAGAVIALTNPGGIRNSIPKTGDGTVTYAEVFAAQPFRNQLVTMTLTGAQLKQALEQQWAGPAFARILQVSRDFGFSYDATRPMGERVPIESIIFRGAPIDPQASYRVTVNEYLASGGDGFSVFTSGTDRRTGVYDVEALEAWFKANSPVTPHVPARIRRVN